MKFIRQNSTKDLIDSQGTLYHRSKQSCGDCPLSARNEGSNMLHQNEM